MGQIAIFYILAALVTFCSIMVVASKNPVSSAIFLVCDLFVLAGIYATLHADFIAAIQVIIYTGAVLVLFVFVIMMLNLSPDAKERIGIKFPDLGFAFLTLVSFTAVTILLVGEPSTGILGPMNPNTIQSAGGNTFVVGMVLFTKYFWPFETASLLILLAVIASIVIAKKEKSPAKMKSSSTSKRPNTKEALAHGPS